LCTCQFLAFPTNYPHVAGDGRLLVESDGRRAMLLDFIEGGTSGSTLLSEGEDRAPPMLTQLGEVLARLHEVTWPSEHKLRDVRSGYPVCNMGDLLKGDELKVLEADSRFAEHPVVAYAGECTPWLRELFERDVPWGLIHGDGFLDNTLYADRPDEGGDCRLLALIDWEDSCVGPLILDLAVSASACCFTASNELLADRLAALLRAYCGRRPLAVAEVASLGDFMAAGALACAFYRFGEFNVRKPDSDAEAKESWKLHLARAKSLRSGATARTAVEATLKQLPS